MIDRIRVATLQYLIRPLDSFQDFEDQVRGLVMTAADYGCRLLVFPEYFTIQLITLSDTDCPVTEQVRRVADRAEAVRELLSGLAKQHKIYIVAGTVPVRLEPGSQRILNRSYFFSPTGHSEYQDKLHMTRFEREHWNVESGEKLKVFDTEFGKVAITICYDVEFPELTRAAAHAGATILVVPSFTDDRQSYLRVRYCAQARAIENQLFVLHSGTVGSLPMVPAVSLNYGQASILTPSDFRFARDGILAEGIPNQEAMVIGDLDLKLLAEARERGTVVPLRDSLQSAGFAATLTEVDLPSE